MIYFIWLFILSYSKNEISDSQSWQIAEVIISIGQSNLVANQGINPHLIPKIKTKNPVWIYSVNNDGTNWHGKNVPLIYKENTGDRYSTIDIYSHYWAANTENQVIHFKHVKGGSSLGISKNHLDWNVNSRNELYDKFLRNWDKFLIDCLSKKIIPIVVLINWAQGENETYGPHSNRKLYLQWWKDLRKAIDTKIGYANNWLVWTLHPCQFDYDPLNKNINVATLRDIFLNKISKEPKVTIFDTSVYDDPLTKDRIHYNEKDIINMAEHVFYNEYNNLNQTYRK